MVVGKRMQIMCFIHSDFYVIFTQIDQRVWNCFVSRFRRRCSFSDASYLEKATKTKRLIF